MSASKIKHGLKILRWKLRRFQTAQRWGQQALEGVPAVLGNAMPKSGSHLIIQILQGLTELGPFVNPGFPPVNRSEDNQKLGDKQVVKNILDMKSGDIAYGYVQARQPFLDLFTLDEKTKKDRLMVFLYRDPRDFIISQVFYATHMHKGHGMHRYYTESLHTMEERINAAIQGVEDGSNTDSSLSNVRIKYDKYLDWLNQPRVLCLRFEDLILDRDIALGKLLDTLAVRGFVSQVTRQQAVETLKQAITPKSSGTFRKGKPGNWKEHFTDVNRKLFKEMSGDLLIRLGYEQNADW